MTRHGGFSILNGRRAESVNKMHQFLDASVGLFKMSDESCFQLGENMKLENSSN
jgi:hypothetical protein